MPLKRNWAEFRLGCLLIACIAASCESQQGDSSQQILAFGTVVELSIYGGDARQVSDVIATIEARYREIDRDWYPWARDLESESASEPGELRRINAALASGQSIDVSADLARLARETRVRLYHHSYR